MSEEIEEEYSAPDYEMKGVDYEIQSIMHPVEGKDMRIAYPEINEMEEFNTMPDADIRFCWYFACPSSPYSSGLTDEDRLFSSVRDAYGENYYTNKAAMALMKNEFSAEIIAGINRMKIISPSYRSRANAMLHKILDNMDILINVPKSQLLVMDSSQKKAFVSVSVDVANNLPNIINQLEGGFSIAKSQAKKNKAGTKVGASIGGSQGDNLMDKVVSSGFDAEEDEVY